VHIRARAALGLADAQAVEEATITAGELRAQLAALLTAEHASGCKQSVKQAELQKRHEGKI